MMTYTRDQLVQFSEAAHSAALNGELNDPISVSAEQDQFVQEVLDRVRRDLEERAEQPETTPSPGS